MESRLTEGLEQGDPTDEEGDGDTHIHIHTDGSAGKAAPSADDADPGASDDPTEARFQAIEQGMKEMGDAVRQLTEAVTKMASPSTGAGDADPEDDEDLDPEDDPTKDADPEEDPGKSKTTDSAALAKGYQQLLADAEVLVPGFRAPTFDAKAKRKAMVDRMCSLRRKVLDAAYLTDPGKLLIDSIHGAKTMDTTTMPCVQVAQLFRAAAGAQRLINNRTATGDASKVPGNQEGQQNKSVAASIAALNEANAKFWGTSA
jgi:hypothetical protein